jgi:hypothetical protein
VFVDGVRGRFDSRAVPRFAPIHLLGIALVSAVTYAPFQTLPLISDDYTQIWLSRLYGAPAGWGQLAADTLYRCRATSLMVTHWVDLAFGLWAPAYFLTNLFVHILNAWAVMLMGRWSMVGYRLSTIAAYVFAVHASHQEAVVWHAALPELLVFTFLMATVLFWIGWLEESRRRWLRYGACLLCFVLCLLSKESGVAAVALLAIIGLAERLPLKRLALALLPFVVLSAVYAAGIFAARQNHLHFNDGTFSLSAPWWITLPHSFLRLLWPWGVIGGVILGALKKLRTPTTGLALLWMLAGLFPYSFLLYMNRVPSRHTYLAGVGVALIAASAYIALSNRAAARGGLGTAFLLVLLLQNSTYLWMKKLPQFERRANVSERFLQYAREHPGPIRVRCYPGSAWTAKHAANAVLGRPLDSVLDATAERGPVNPADYCDTSSF